MDHLPEDIYGMKIFKIKCLPREWVKEHMTSGTSRYILQKGKGLIGTRNVGRYLGKVYASYVVYHKIVQGLQTHKSGNRKQECASVPVIVILFPAIDQRHLELREHVAYDFLPLTIYGQDVLIWHLYMIASCTATNEFKSWVNQMTSLYI